MGAGGFLKSHVWNMALSMGPWEGDKVLPTSFPYQEASLCGGYE